MKAAIRKEKLLEIVPLSESTINKLEKEGEFPKRFAITDSLVAWNQDEIEAWLDERQARNEVETDERLKKMVEKNPNHIKARQRAEKQAAI